MPLYEYICQDCQSEFELLIRGSEQPEHPTCGTKQLERKFSVPAAHTSSGLNLAQQPGNCGRPQCGLGGCQMM